jgi:membrane fusion protein (multidrug efflux system)
MEKIEEEINNNPKLPLIRFILLIVIPTLIVLFSIGFYYSLGRYIKTENAYIKAPIISIQSQISGRIVDVYIEDNQNVNVGDKLFKLDTSKLKLDLLEQQENLNTIKQEIENRKAKLNEAKAEVNLAKQKAKFYKSEIKRVRNVINIDISLANEKLKYYKSEYNRIKILVKNGVGLKSKLEEVQYLYKSAIENVKLATLNNQIENTRHLYKSSKKELKLSEEKVKTILTTLFGDEYLNSKKHPLYLKNLTRLSKIKLDISRSTVYAKQDGTIAKMSIEKGEYINVGKILFAIVDEEKAWLEVNLKETDLTNVAIGQSAIFTPDSYPNVSWRGTVESLSPATGSEFSILPPQNSSGNWVKVVQRVPVRLAIGNIIKNKNIELKNHLRVGMSVFVTIDTKYEKAIPYIIRPFSYFIKLF